MSPLEPSFSPQPCVYSHQPPTVKDAVLYSCGLFDPLASLFPTAVFYFQQLAHSLVKTPGVGVPLRELRTLSACPSCGRVLALPLLVDFACPFFSCSYELPPSYHRFAGALFSCDYELLFSQPLYFQNDLRCPLLPPVIFALASKSRRGCRRYRPHTRAHQIQPATKRCSRWCETSISLQ